MTHKNAGKDVALDDDAYGAGICTSGTMFE